MFRRLLPRLLFRLALGASLLLIVLVILSPLADNGQDERAGWGRLLGLFARDAALRRTAVACAIGLAVTACIFFRRPDAPRPPPPRRRRGPTAPPPSGVAGA